MTEYRHLDNAPIKEALIDIRVVLPEDVNIKNLQASEAEFIKRYPINEEIKKREVGVHFKDDEMVTTTSDVEPVGYKFYSEDKAKIVQFRNDGFTFSQLEPYDRWDTMREEAEAAWEVYLKSVKPVSISRVATRFINVIRIPLPINEFEDYLQIPPDLPKALPQGISSFLMRFVMHDPELGATGILTQALEAIDGEHAPVVLDIDVFINKELDADENEHWGLLNQLRGFKNKIFFESITEETARLCQ
jgi:uncharacterized protein (TIGR04255 family)